ncbi:hypothetical protein BDW62DRAFT_159548 [Aspergillus aurantiobrunneus]
MSPKAPPSTPMQNACIGCHEKKAKCNIAKKSPCSNCTKSGSNCVKQTNSLSLPEKPGSKDRNGSNKHNANKTDSNRNPSNDSNKTHRLAKGPSLAKELDAIQKLDPIQTHGGRDRLLGRRVSFDEAMVTPMLSKENPLLVTADVQLLREQGAFILPSNAVQHELISTFMNYGHVWAPIIDPAWLAGTKPSFLLLQAIFVAASRMTTQPGEYGLSADFHRRAKLLFFFGVERDPLISITSAILLHWYNPVGPDTISTDTSSFWLCTAESIAFQIGLHQEPPAKDRQRGLRRRLWWTLVLLDCLVSARAGRPRTINLRDSDVLPPSLDDFAEQDSHARIFPVYVSICQRLGDIVERCLRRELTPDHQRALENSLFRWVRQDFAAVTGPFPGFSMQARQVLVAYLAALIILDRTPASDGAVSARSLLAASFIAGLFREFVERDEICRLGTAFTFYALSAGLMLMPASRVERLRDWANEDTIIVKASLHILAKQWGSASGALRALQKVGKEGTRRRSRIHDAAPVNDEIRAFFDGLDTRWCRLWGPIVENDLVQTVSSLQGSQRSLLEPYVNAQARAWDVPPLPVEYPGLAGDGDVDLGGSWLLESTQPSST